MVRVSYKTGTTECDRALFLDESKSALFKLFFGWRRTFLVDNIEIMDFIFKKKDILLIEGKLQPSDKYKLKEKDTEN